MTAIQGFKIIEIRGKLQKNEISLTKNEILFTKKWDFLLYFLEKNMKLIIKKRKVVFKRWKKQSRRER